MTGSCGDALQLCSTTVTCPMGYRCEPLTVGGTVEVCRQTGGNIPDGGLKFPDAGFKIPDAGGD